MTCRISRYSVVVAKRGERLQVVNGFQSRPAAALYACRRRDGGWTAYVVHLRFPAEVGSRRTTTAEAVGRVRLFVQRLAIAAALGVRR